MYGLRGTDCITILTFIIRNEDEDFENVLPAGVEALGELTASREDLSLNFPLGAIKEEDGTLSFLLLESDDWVVVKPTVIDNAQLATLRVRAKLPIQLSVKNEETDSLLSKLDDKLNSDAAAYLLEGSRVITICNGDQSIIHGAPQDVSVEELACYIVPDDDEDGGKPSKRVADKTRPLDFQLYWSSVLASLEGVPQCAPLIYQQKSKKKIFSDILPIHCCILNLFFCNRNQRYGMFDLAIRLCGGDSLVRLCRRSGSNPEHCHNPPAEAVRRRPQGAAESGQKYRGRDCPGNRPLLT